MNFFKKTVYIFITVVLMGFCALNIADAIRIDFLNKSTGLQPPPLNVSTNISGNINSYVNQDQPAQNPQNSNLLPKGASFNSVASNQVGNALTSKNISHQYNFLWLAFFLMIAVLAAVLFFYAVKKKRLSR
jgi:hypothetical protein